MGNIVWLASYPKSGNTWFRAFLANLRNEKEDPADINHLGGGPIFSSRPVFDSNTCIQSSDMLPDEIDNLRPAVYRKLSEKATETIFMKAHDAYTYLKNGKPLFPTEATKGAICLVRNPLDVSVSFANHSSCSVEETIPQMNDESDAFCGNPKNLANQLRQQLLGWSSHVKSWLKATEIDVHFVRYEDMKLTPLKTFGEAVKFSGLEHSDLEIQQALDACDFEKLKKQEEEEGFREKSAKVESFFRKGEIGSWEEALTETQARTLIEKHAAIMKRFGYLDDHGEIVFSAKHPLLATRN